MINKQIYVTSLTKAIYSAKLRGKLDVKIILLFNLFKYYINYTENLTIAGSNQFKDITNCLKKEILKLLYKYPTILCNYKVVIPNDPEGIYIKLPNTAPTVSDNTIDIVENESYTFKVGDFLTDFYDVNNDSYKYLIIYPIETATYGDINITTPIIINIENKNQTDLLNLIYTRTEDNIFNSDIIKFRVSDNADNFLYSNLQNIYIISTEINNSENNPPADIGDNTLYVDNRAVTIITLAMLTTGLTLPYSDPEGDLLDAIKIIDISNANTGKYYLNSVEIVVNQIITREEIEAGLFTHEGPDVDSITSDVFQFQGRDEGSKIWVD